MTFYSDEYLRQIEAARSSLQDRYEVLLHDFMTYQFSDVSARDHAIEGYCRRLGLLVRCITNVFLTIPPDFSRQPTDSERQDCDINIHAFVINVFGSLDNLAWLWVAERPVVKDNGLLIDKHQVKLRSKLVFPTLPVGLQADLDSYEKWFAGMEEYRDTLAHRIPLYVPPYTVSESKAAEYNRLESEIGAARRSRNYVECNRLSAEQDALGTFSPIMKHSPARDGRPGYAHFHPQLLADFATVESIGRKILSGVAAHRA